MVVNVQLTTTQEDALAFPGVPRPGSVVCCAILLVPDRSLALALFLSLLPSHKHAPGARAVPLSSLWSNASICWCSSSPSSSSCTQTQKNVSVRVADGGEHAGANRDLQATTPGSGPWKVSRPVGSTGRRSTTPPPRCLSSSPMPSIPRRCQLPASKRGCGLSLGPKRLVANTASGPISASAPWCRSESDFPRHLGPLPGRSEPAGTPFPQSRVPAFSQRTRRTKLPAAENGAARRPRTNAPGHDQPGFASLPRLLGQGLTSRSLPVGSGVVLRKSSASRCPPIGLRNVGEQKLEVAGGECGGIDSLPRSRGQFGRTIVYFSFYFSGQHY